MADGDDLFEAKPVSGTPANDAAGHRSRLRQRLLVGGTDAIADHEIIEYLLMLAIPRREAADLAALVDLAIDEVLNCGGFVHAAPYWPASSCTRSMKVCNPALGRSRQVTLFQGSHA